MYIIIYYICTYIYFIYYYNQVDALYLPIRVVFEGVNL